MSEAAGVTAHLVSGTDDLKYRGAKVSESLNVLGLHSNVNEDPNLTRRPDYYLHVFNIAPREFEVRRPPSFPILRFKACPEGKAWERVGSYPNIINERYVNDNNEILNRGYMAERFLTDILNPQNPTNDIWMQPSDPWVDNGGSNDLTRRGLFWSKNETPTDEELRKARARMEAHYRRLLVEGDESARKGKWDEIGPEHHLAAAYFKTKNAWHQVAEMPANCPICGETIPQGIAFHRNAIGSICVLDWKKSVEAGVKTRAEVPEEHRWWGKKAEQAAD